VWRGHQEQGQWCFEGQLNLFFLLPDNIFFLNQHVSLWSKYFWFNLWIALVSIVKINLEIKKNWNHNFVQFFPLKFWYFLDRNFNAYFLTVSAVNILGVTAWKPFLFRVRFGWLHVGLRVEETKSGS